MLRATFTFYGNLNDFLAERRRHAFISLQLAEHAAVKHPIEALGVPHPEVAAILVNRQPVDFAYRLQDGDRVEVYPQEVVHLLPRYLPLRPPTPMPICFVADTHLGQLAAYLRLLGFDTLYRNDYDDAQLAEIAAMEPRVLLTRDRGLLKRRIVVHGYCVREVDPRAQIVSVLRRYRLRGCIQPWRRCTHCNGLLRAVDKATVLDRLQPKTKRYYDEFQQCAACGQVYWQGSHFTQMAAFVDAVLAQL
ncbi:MAG TPA: Mut7-C ubiquitin/RNAse domain-containing protein [Chloroflexi bacterium]|nr:Mut7-C ubiquitin/RNAse domain-containing protein [Chloroflexota bacterium]